MKCQVMDYVQRLESLLEDWSRPLGRSLTARERQTLEEILADIRDLCSSYENALTQLAAYCAVGSQQGQDPNEWEARIAFCREQARDGQDCEVLDAAYQRLRDAVSGLVRGERQASDPEQSGELTGSLPSDGT